MKEIGTNFELELNDNESIYPPEAIAVNAGRNSL